MRTPETDDGASATLPPPPPAPPSSITTGGDPSSYIYGDPGYQALKASLSANEDAQASQNRANIQRQALQAGYDIPELGQYLDAGMEDQIRNNPYSQAALANQAHSNNLRDIQNALAARGGYNSGELTYGLGNEDQRFTTEGLNNRAALLDSLDTLLGQQAQTRGSDAAQLAQELGAATSRQAQLHPVGTANWDASTGTYVDQYGNHFNQDGSPYVASASKPSSTASRPAAVSRTRFNLGAINQVSPFGSR